MIGHIVFILSSQLCGGSRLPCLYVCRDCLGTIFRSLSYSSGIVQDLTPFAAHFYKGYNPLRLMTLGARFEYVHIAFEDFDYTIRKELHD
jgi:hypothetical protein